MLSLLTDGTKLLIKLNYIFCIHVKIFFLDFVHLNIQINFIVYIVNSIKKINILYLYFLNIKYVNVDGCNFKIFIFVTLNS